jgi:hypothetical protein
MRSPFDQCFKPPLPASPRKLGVPVAWMRDEENISRVISGGLSSASAAGTLSAPPLAAASNLFATPAPMSAAPISPFLVTSPGGLSQQFHAPQAYLSPHPIQVNSDVALSQGVRNTGLSQWAITSLKSRIRDDKQNTLISNPLDEHRQDHSPGSRAYLQHASSVGGSVSQKEHPAHPVPEPVMQTMPVQKDTRLAQSLAILANTGGAMPWVKSIEIGHGVVFTGFVDDEGLPDLFGYIEYFGEDAGIADNVGGDFSMRLHTQHGTAYTAKHEVQSFFTLPSVVTNIVHRTRPAASGRPALAVYLGAVHRGGRHGLGRIRYASGAEYSGTWHHDQIRGVGVERRIGGSRYYGCMLRKRYHGHGLLVEHHPAKGFQTTEGLFTGRISLTSATSTCCELNQMTIWRILPDGCRDLVAVLGQMQNSSFHITRDLAVSYYSDHVIAREPFQTRLPENVKLIEEVNEAFVKALEAERGTSFIANLVLEMDNLSMSLVSYDEAQAMGDFTNSCCILRYETSSQVPSATISLPHSLDVS